MDQLKEQPCPMCRKNTLTLSEDEQDIPYFGKVAAFGMECESCDFSKHDIEALEPKDPVKYTFEVTSEDDLSVRIVKSSEATVKIPHIITIEPGPASNGYVTNVEGILNRAKDAVEAMRDSDDDPAVKKKCKNMLKKIQRVVWGREKVKITLEDPSGNSAIISESAVKAKLK